MPHGQRFRVRLFDVVTLAPEASLNVVFAFSLSFLPRAFLPAFVSLTVRAELLPDFTVPELSLIHISEPTRPY